MNPIIVSRVRSILKYAKRLIHIDLCPVAIHRFQKSVNKKKDKLIKKNIVHNTVGDQKSIVPVSCEDQGRVNVNNWLQIIRRQIFSLLNDHEKRKWNEEWKQRLFCHWTLKWTILSIWVSRAPGTVMKEDIPPCGCTRLPAVPHVSIMSCKFWLSLGPLSPSLTKLLSRIVSSPAQPSPAHQPSPAQPRDIKKTLTVQWRPE